MTAKVQPLLAVCSVLMGVLFFRFYVEIGAGFVEHGPDRSLTAMGTRLLVPLYSRRMQDPTKYSVMSDEDLEKFRSLGWELESVEVSPEEMDRHVFGIFARPVHRRSIERAFFLGVALPGFLFSAAATLLYSAHRNRHLGPNSRAVDDSKEPERPPSNVCNAINQQPLAESVPDPTGGDSATGRKESAQAPSNLELAIALIVLFTIQALMRATWPLLALPPIVSLSCWYLLGFAKPSFGSALRVALALNLGHAAWLVISALVLFATHEPTLPGNSIPAIVFECAIYAGLLLAASLRRAGTAIYLLMLFQIVGLVMNARLLGGANSEQLFAPLSVHIAWRAACLLTLSRVAFQRLARER